MKKKKLKKGTLDVDTLKQMVRGIMSSREDEIDCDECFEQLDHFSELSLAGKSADEALPLVKQHLETCPDCKEEFEVLLKALNAVSSKGG
ncbi:hypothetical protein LCGC14_3015300 [marine sediment metagenome]|uniref:Zinc-finger domain-containing protein n=1 Tax=marine sediment metagenome TaxID=412755 RepID=A0A0F8ZN22_9ZZZZ